MKLLQLYKGQFYLAVFIFLLPLLIAILSGEKNVNIWIKTTEKKKLLTTIKQGNINEKMYKEESYAIDGQASDLLIPLIIKQNCEIVSYKPFNTMVTDHFALKTHEITIKGPFKEILRIIYTIELNIKYKIISIEFVKHPVSYERRYEELTAKLIIQTISRI